MTGSDAVQLALVAATQTGEAGQPDDGLWVTRAGVLCLCALAVALILWSATRRGDAQADPHVRWILLIAFLILSPLVFVLNFGLAIQGSKPVAFCDSCHVMNPYVQDLQNPESELLAAQHYQFRWIADHQCYTCHSDYGLFGNAGAKLAGLRHFWKYYVAGYEEPLKIRGTYNNQRCLFCHGPVVGYREIAEHKKNAEAINSSEKSCIGASCHVAPHPKSKTPVKEARRD